MRREVDAARLFFIECQGDQQEDNPEEKRGQIDRDKEDPHEVHRVDQHIGEDDCRDSAGGTQPKVRRVLLLLEIGGEDGNQQGGEV